MDGSPARSILPKQHQLHVAEKEGGSATIVAVFCQFFSVVAGCRIVVCRKIIQNGLPSIVNSLRPILVRAGTKNSLFFRLLRRNQYESFRRWRFALVLFFS
jgi:hypothetical protein